MHITFKGEVVDEPTVRVGFVGCGSHSFRNLYPALQFVPVDLVAVCDVQREKAEAFAARFGANSAHGSLSEMLAAEDLEAVFLCTGYDHRGRPQYPALAVQCLVAGCHVWMEKPPAGTCAELAPVRAAAEATGLNVGVGLKKMFFPANEKAKDLMSAEGFGRPEVVLLQYPQYVPTVSEFHEYLVEQRRNAVVGFLDHLCHPVALLLHLLGMPESLYYDRSDGGAGMATFRYASGALASLALTKGQSHNGGMERTTIVSGKGQHIAVENNVRVTLHRTPPLGYGDVPSFFTGTPAQASAVWEPEFSLGQLYNKGLFLLGYYNEINEFVRSILEQRPVAKGTLEHAFQVTRIFEAFAEGPGKPIALGESP